MIDLSKQIFSLGEALSQVNGNQSSLPQIFQSLDKIVRPPIDAEQFQQSISERVKETLHQVRAKTKDGEVKAQDLQELDKVHFAQAVKAAKPILDLMQDQSRKKLLVFDIDGTLRTDEPYCWTHKHPEIEPYTFANLLKLQEEPNTRVVFLTRRNQEFLTDLSKTEYDKIPCFLTEGKSQLLHQGSVENLSNKSPEIARETETLKKLITKVARAIKFPLDGTSIIDDAGSILVNLRETNFSDFKDQFLSYFTKLLPEENWHVYNLGNYIIFTHKKVDFTKADGMKLVLRKSKDFIDGNTDVYCFGDTSSDYIGMQALKRTELPQGARKFNISVGNKLKDKEGINFNLPDYKATNILINTLAA